MKNRLPCELIRDLLPSYIENLTSDVTNNLIEEHLDTCEECKRVHDSMREPLEKSEDIEELQEIDFLKTARKKTRKIIFGISLAVVVIVTALVIAKEYFVGTQISSEYVACYVDVKENTLELSGRIVDEKLDISKVQFQEDDGVVTISFQSVHNSPFYDNEFEECNVKKTRRINYDFAGIRGAYAIKYGVLHCISVLLNIIRKREG